MTAGGDSTGISVGQLLVTEYEQVKEEQRARIGFRDNLLYATPASMAAVIAAAMQAKHVELLLLLPPVSLVLGWAYLVNDEKISAIGHYVREDLAPRLRALAASGRPEAGVPVFGWETAHRDDRRRRSRKYLQLAVDLLTFCGAAVSAVVVFWTAGRVTVPLVALLLVEPAAVAVLAGQIVTYADLRR